MTHPENRSFRIYHSKQEGQCLLTRRLQGVNQLLQARCQPLDLLPKSGDEFFLDDKPPVAVSQRIA